MTLNTEEKTTVYMTMPPSHNFFTTEAEM
jgi:hypothetical protein